MTRREFARCAAAGTAGLTAAWAVTVDPAYQLIAHRGGVVDDAHAENSPGSLEAAIARGYWMVEVDVRRTSDGEPVLQHDANFQRYYGDARKVEEMTWAEVSQLKATPGGHRPIHFRDLCRMCEGKVRLMLDIKSNEFPVEFYRGIGDLMRRHKLFATAYMLGGGSVAAEAVGCRRSSNRTTLAAAIARGEDVRARYFLFELASELDEPTVAMCRKAGVEPVAAINTFRYTMAKRDEWQGPAEDAARLKALGVRQYQIDSRYDPLFAKK